MKLFQCVACYVWTLRGGVFRALDLKSGGRGLGLISDHLARDTSLRWPNTRYKNPQLVAQHCFVASFVRCFPFFTLRDQLDQQQKHLFRVEEMQRADWLFGRVRANLLRDKL